MSSIEAYSIKQLAAELARKAQQAEQDAQSKVRNALNEIQASIAARLGTTPMPKPTVALAAANGNGAHKATRKTRKAKAKVMFRNPRNPLQTWSGRGRAPRWLPVGAEREAFRA